MRLLIDTIDWEYPQQRQGYQPTLWDLEDRNTLLSLVLAFGNGVILELRAEAESQVALDVLIGLAVGTGACTKIMLDPEIAERLWLYDATYDCYQQGTKSPAYIFIHPFPQPHKFPPR